LSTQPATTAEPVRASVVVEVPIERAFEVFTTGMATWWPETAHVGEADFAELVIETRVGGQIIDRCVDGSETRWATVLAYEPPTRFTFSWNITAQWTPETDPARCSEVEIRFIPRGPDRTLVELEHRHIERHGAGWEDMHAHVGDPAGWGGILRGYAAVLEGRAADSH
jgi:uncharacterized protein YndB with AHSA1/START domain